MPDALLADATPTQAREHALLAWLARQGSVLIGYSGGVDSTYLAACALEALGPERVLAVIGRSASLPEDQWRAARQAAERLGIPIEEIETEELADPRYAANPSNRCYFCKTELWSRLVPLARRRGLAVVIDGTNASDLGGHRPGAAAARQHGVASPLAEVGLTKDEIRALSRARDLPTWSQPSAPCLASRIPYGTGVTPERLRAVERAEGALRALGISGDLRVRHHGTLARIELSPDELDHHLVPSAAARLTSAVLAAGAGFERVAIDLRAFRSGGLLEIGRKELDGPRSAPAAEALADALERLGVAASIDAVGPVTVVRVTDPSPLRSADARQALLGAAHRAGVRTVALEMRVDAPPQ